MGFYINPTDGRSKEEFLMAEAKPVNFFQFEDFDDLWDSVPSTKVIVVHIDNGAFTAAGVAYSRDELVALLSPEDVRPKRIFSVDINKLHGLFPESFFTLLARHGRKAEQKAFN